MGTTDPAQRLGYIGGTDIQHVLNLDPYGCARRLWYEKTGAEKDCDFRLNAAIVAGKLMEDGIAELVIECTGWKLRRKRASANGHELQRIDREIVGHEDGPGILEIKSVSDRAYWAWKRDGIPMGYVLQVQWYLRVLKRSWAAVAAFNRDTGALDIFNLQADEALAATVATYVDDFMSDVKSGTPPPWLAERDGRCESCEWEATCRSEEWENVGDVGGVRMDELTDKVAKFRQLKLIESEARTDADLIGAEIRARLGDNSLVQIGGWKASYKVQESWRVPADKLRREYPEIYQELAERSVTRPLRINHIKTGASK